MKMIAAAALLALPTMAAAQIDCETAQEAAKDTRATMTQLLGHGTNAATTIAVMVAEGRIGQDVADDLAEEIASPILADAEAAIDTAVKWKEAAANCR